MPLTAETRVVAVMRVVAVRARRGWSFAPLPGPGPVRVPVPGPVPVLYSIL